MFMLIAMPDSTEINTTNEKFRTLLGGIWNAKRGWKNRYSSSQARVVHVAKAKAPARAM
jgi:hypothetical protein